MSSRKCIFTGQDSDTKRSVVPREKAEGEIHNWALYSPMNMSYNKENRMPTDVEMEIHETFYMLELARLKVKYLEMKLKDLQEKNTKSTPKHTKSTPKKKKDKEIKMAIHEKEVIQETDLDKVLDKRKKKTVWD